MEPRKQLSIRGRRLAALLRISPLTPARWHGKGVLRGRRGGRYGDIWFTEEAVNEFLAKGIRNYPPITLHDLLTGKVRLANHDDIKKELQLPENEIPSFIRYGGRPTVQLGGKGGEVRLLIQCPLFKVSAEVVGHVLGLSVARVQQLLYRREIEPTGDTPFQAYYNSFIEFVAARLKGQVDAEEWVKERMASRLPILTLAQATGVLGGEKTLNRFVGQGKLVCLYSGRIVGVCPASVERCYVDEPEVTTLMLGQLFGVPRRTMATWVHDKVIDCFVHDHSNGKPLRRPCALNLLREYLSPGMRPEEWYSHQIDRQRVLVDSAGAAAMLGVSLHQVTAMAAAGEISGLRLPDYSWVFTKSQVKSVKMRLAGAADTR